MSTWIKPKVIVLSEIRTDASDLTVQSYEGDLKEAEK